jgi:hypothetical protein
MGLYHIIRDTTLGKKIAVPYPGFAEYNETVSTSSKSEFSIGITFDADHKIIIMVDGRRQQEGVAWTRNVGTQKITATSNVNVGSWFNAIVYLK